LTKSVGMPRPWLLNIHQWAKNAVGKNDALMTHRTKHAFSSAAGIALCFPATVGAVIEVAMRNPVRARLKPWRTPPTNRPDRIEELLRFWAVAGFFPSRGPGEGLDNLVRVRSLNEAKRIFFVINVRIFVLPMMRNWLPVLGAHFQNDSAISRRDWRPSFARTLSLEKRGSRECRMRAAPAVPCAKWVEKNAHEHTGSAEAIRHSLRNGFTAYSELSPATNSFCHRHRRISGISAPGWADIPPPT
jgi:hypothetical protein